MCNMNQIKINFKNLYAFNMNKDYANFWNAISFGLLQASLWIVGRNYHMIENEQDCNDTI